MDSAKRSASKLKVWSVLAALATILMFRGIPTAQGEAKQKPSWRINVHKFGLPEPRISMEWPKMLISRGSFGFQNNDTLVVSWITPDEPLPRLPKRKKYSPLPIVPAHLKMIFLDVKTGMELREQLFPVPSAPTQLLFNHSGDLVIRAGDSLRLYAPDFRLLREVNLKSIAFASGVQVSPDGLRIMLRSRQGQSVRVEILDATDLRSLDSWSEDQPNCDYELGNDLALIECYGPRSFSVYKTGQNKRTLELPMTDHQNSIPLRVQLLNDDALAVISGNQISLLTTDGKLIFTDALPKRYLFWSATTARDSGRFAIEIRHMRGLTIPSLDMYAFPSADQLTVYSLNEQKRIFAVPLKGMSPWTPWNIVRNSAALSPDGSLLAILSNDSVEVYTLP